MTLFSVFLKEKIGIPGFSFVKEFLLMGMVGVIAYFHFFGGKKIQWTKYDICIGLYVATMVGISIFTTWISWLIYGWRYDFSFFIAFFAIYHGYVFLKEPISYYLKLFLFSWWVMIFLSFLLKWPLSEDILLYFGFCGNPSNWHSCNGVPPIFHWVDGANVRRFQWILDWPNTMWAFLLVYIWIFLYYFRTKKAWYFMLGAATIFLSILIFYTYSRSAILWLFWWVWIVILLLLPKIYKKFRAEFITITLIVFSLIGGVMIQYSWNMKAIIERWWSTNWHIERMLVGIERFKEHPFWQWLWSAGPAYRYIENSSTLDPKISEDKDRYYIPESWYIQQLIEWWILWILTFLVLIGYIFVWLSRVHIILAGTFLSILIMNFFLHTFESSTISLSLFLIIWLLLSYFDSQHASRK
jgi:hypothetical protein